MRIERKKVDGRKDKVWVTGAGGIEEISRYQVHLNGEILRVNGAPAQVDMADTDLGVVIARTGKPTSQGWTIGPSPERKYGRVDIHDVVTGRVYTQT